jgi:hypothetical protein
VNRQAATEKVGHEQFYIPELTDKVDVKRDYFKWLVDAPNKVSGNLKQVYVTNSPSVKIPLVFRRNSAFATTHLFSMPKPRLCSWKPTRIYRCIQPCKKLLPGAFTLAFQRSNSTWYLRVDVII